MAIAKLGLGSGRRIVYACLAACVAASASSAVHAQSPLADSTRRDSLPATLVGHVVDSMGVGVPGAEITLNKSDKVHAISGDSGEFRIAGVPPGTVTFNVRRIGFEAASFTAVLRPGKTQRAKFALSATAQALPVVNIADTANKS